MSSTEQLVDIALAEQFAKQLKARQWRAGTAESCTGGGIGWLLTSVAGSSDWFEGGFVTYSNAMKREFLSVSAEILETDGAVSEACAAAMAQGARQALNCDLAMSVTGIAGPGGGSTDKPVGTVCFAWSTAKKTTVQTCIFEGNREQIRHQSVIFSIKQAIEIMNKI